MTESRSPLLQDRSTQDVLRRLCVVVLLSIILESSNTQAKYDPQEVHTGSVSVSDRPAQSNSDYVETLRRKYSGRISYSSLEAQELVARFQIDCHVPDGRTLPLINVLYAKLQDADSPALWLTIRVEMRGDDTRIYDIAMGKKGPVYKQVSFELNKWGELQSIGARTSAVLSSCLGTYGPIWVPGIALANRSSDRKSNVDISKNSNSVPSLAQLKSGYMLAITRRIQGAWIKPASGFVGIDCLVEVTQVPGGTITDAQVTQCNGDASVRQSIESAVHRASPLPNEPDPLPFESHMIIRFRPDK